MLRSILSLFFLAGCVTQSGELAPISNTIVEEVPYVTSVSSTSGTFTAGDNISFLVQFSEPVFVDGTPSLYFKTETTKYAANYISGSGSKNLVFSFSIGGGISDYDGVYLTSPLVLNAGAIYSSFDGDNAELKFPGTQTATIISTGGGGSAPSITTIAGPPVSPQASGKYERGMAIRFTVEFDQNVVVTGTPSLPIKLGTPPIEIARNASYSSGNGSSTLTFVYYVDESDVDTDGVSIDDTLSQLNVNASNMISGTNGNNADVSFTAPAPFTNAIVDGTLGPKLDAANPIIIPDGYEVFYEEVGFNTIEFTLNFDRQVQVATGNPKIEFKIGTETRQATWITDSNFTSSHKFQYTVGEYGNFDVDLDGIEITGFVPGGVVFADPHGATSSSIPDSEIIKQNGGKVAGAAIRHWYDLSDMITVGNSTSFLNQFGDIMFGQNNGLTSSPSIPYYTGYVDLRSYDTIQLSNNIPKDDYILVVYHAGSANSPGTILANKAGTSILTHQAGQRTLTGSVACQSQGKCKYINSAGVWRSNAGLLSDLTSSPFEKKLTVFKLSRMSDLDLQVARDTSFWLFELLIIDGSVPEENVKKVADELLVKQSASY